MAADAAVRAGRAFVELFADPSKLDAGLAKAAGKLQAWGGSISAIGSRLAGGTGAALGPLYAAASLLGGGGAIVAGFLTAAKGAADTGRELLFLSQRTGVSVEELSKLKFAAERSGVPLEDLDHLLGKMHKTVLEAAKGSADATLALARLGTSAADLGALAPVDQLRRLADGLQRVEDVTLRDALAMGVFGRGGREVLTFLGEGSGKIDTLMKRAEELGIVMSTQDVKAAKAFGSAMAEITAVSKYCGFVIGSAVAPVFADLVKQATPYVKTAVAWVRENQGVIVSVLKVGGALVAAGLGMKLFGAAVSTAAGALKFMIPGLSPLSLTTYALRALLPVALALPGAVAGVVSSFRLLIPAVTGTFAVAQAMVGGLRFLVTGFVIAKTAIVGALVAMRTAIMTLEGTFGGLGALKALGSMLMGVGSALLTWAVPIALIAAAGVALYPVFKNLGSEVLGGLGKAWQATAAAFRDAWPAIKADALTAWGGIVDAVQSGDLMLAAKIAWAGFKTVFYDVLGALRASWIDFIRFLRIAWEGFNTSTASMMVDWAAGFKEAWAALKISATGDTEEEKRRRFQEESTRIAREQQKQQESLLGDRGENLRKINAEADEARKKALESTKADADAAREELKRLTDEAARKRREQAKKVEDAAAIGAGGGGPGLGGLSAVGTFNPFGAAALGAGGVFDRIEDKLGDLLEVNRRIQQAIEDGSLFA
jgi:hypothetical protein